MNELITVITCIHNTPVEWAKCAVDSILAQTYDNFEYFVIDDGSSEQLARQYEDLCRDPRISYIRLYNNVGPAEARNIALKKARGKFVAIMDSDDYSLPERFERQVSYLEQNQDIAVVGTWFSYFGSRTEEVKRYIDDTEYYRCCLLFGNAPTILNPSTMIRKSFLDKYNIKYDRRLKKAEDYKMWVQLSERGGVTNIHENLFRYRAHDKQTSSVLRTKDVSEYDWIVMKEQFDKVGILWTDSEEILLKKDYTSDEVPAYEYWLLLNKMLEANKKSKYYDQGKFEKRVREQWKSKVFHTKNPGRMLQLLMKLPVKEKINVIRFEFARAIRKVLDLLSKD